MIVEKAAYDTYYGLYFNPLYHGYFAGNTPIHEVLGGMYQGMELTNSALDEKKHIDNEACVQFTADVSDGSHITLWLLENKMLRPKRIEITGKDMDITVDTT